MGGRLVLWWVDVYTRVLPDPLGRDRRGELLADVYDQLLAGHAAGLSPGRSSRRILWRAVRGVPADLWWRLEVEWERDRLGWLLSNPSAVLTFLFIVLVPVTLLADVEREGVLREVFAPVMGTLALLLVAYALAVATWRVTTRSGLFRTAPTPGLPLLVRVRRFTLPAMFFFFALSGLWRDSPDPFGQIAAAAWGLFGISLAFNLGSFLLLLVRRRTSRLDFGKVPS